MISESRVPLLKHHCGTARRRVSDLVSLLLVTWFTYWALAAYFCFLFTSEGNNWKQNKKCAHDIGGYPRPRWVHRVVPTKVVGHLFHTTILKSNKVGFAEYDKREECVCGKKLFFRRVPFRFLDRRQRQRSASLVQTIQFHPFSYIHLKIISLKVIFVTLNNPNKLLCSVVISHCSR